LEALIEYVFYADGLTLNSCNIIIHLFHNGDELREAIKKAAGRKKQEASSNVLTINCIASFCGALFGEPSASKQQAQQLIREEKEVVKILLQTAFSCLQMLSKNEIKPTEKKLREYLHFGKGFLK